MNRFTTPLLLRALAPAELKVAETDRQLYQLTGELRYQSDAFGEIVVPAGYYTDFASIPRGALWYVDDDDPCILFPSVVHDYLYTQKGALPDRVALDREQSDQVLREAMLASGARAAQAWVVYKAVRLGGGGHWK